MCRWSFSRSCSGSIFYASGSFKGVLVCFGWGIVAFWLALQINSYIVQFVGFTLLVTLIAPMIEEVQSPSSWFTTSL